MKLELYRSDGTLDGNIDWDPDTGKLSGDLAEQVARDIGGVVAYGGLNSHPYPTWYDINDPLHNRDEMAVVLNYRWRCPPELIPYLPKLPPDHSPELPPGATY